MSMQVAIRWLSGPAIPNLKPVHTFLTTYILINVYASFASHGAAAWDCESTQQSSECRASAGLTLAKANRDKLLRDIQLPGKYDVN